MNTLPVMSMDHGGAKHFSPLPTRRSIRLKGYDYSQAGAYFVTICAQNRKCLFGDVVGAEMVLNDAGRVVQMVWVELPNHYEHVQLDSFGMMPNHLHAIIALVGAGLKPAPTRAPTHQRHRLSEIVRGFKTFSARRINEIRHRPGTSIWQRNYYEHVVRNEDELNRIREYIASNPLQWALDRENPRGAAGSNFTPPSRDQTWMV